MKKVYEAARRASESLKNPPPTLRALIARLGATLGAEEGKAAAEELVAEIEEDVADAEGEGDAVVAAAHLRLASALERAGRKADAAAEVDEAASIVEEDADRDAQRFRVHVALADRFVERGDRDAATRQLALAAAHVPLDDREEHPAPEFAPALALAHARAGDFAGAVALLSHLDPEARSIVFLEGIGMLPLDEKEAAWAQPFLAGLKDLARGEGEEDDDVFTAALRASSLARAQLRIGATADARATLTGIAARLGEREEGDGDPELDAIRAELAASCAAAELCDDALELVAPIPDAANVALGLLRPLAKAGAPWRGRALELARGADRPTEALLEIAAGDADRKSAAEAKTAIAEAEGLGLADAEWGTVATVRAAIGDAEAARAAAEHLRSLEIDVLEPFAALSLQSAVEGAEAAGDRALAEDLLADALEALADSPDRPGTTREQTAVDLAAVAVEISAKRAK